MGCVKAGADHVVIAGHDGGTGASPLSSIQGAGVPWEIGIAETQQALLESGLRTRVILQTDGQMRTGRDVVDRGAARRRRDRPLDRPADRDRLHHDARLPPQHLPGRRGDPGSGASSPLLGQARARRQLHDHGRRGGPPADGLARRSGASATSSGVPSCSPRTSEIEHWKASSIDLAPLLAVPPKASTRRAASSPGTRRSIRSAPPSTSAACSAAARPAIESGTEVEFETTVTNIDLAVGGRVSNALVVARGADGLPDDTIEFTLNGSAGQTAGAWLAPGITINVHGDVNDYAGKGLSGGILAVRPDERAGFKAERNVIAGNVALYGATAGKAFFRGLAGERFAVRNSGALAVVEGIGEHGCEYMTGGCVVVLGPTGRNFAAGMSGGIACIWDPEDEFAPQLQHGDGRARAGPSRRQLLPPRPRRRARAANRLAGRPRPPRPLGGGRRGVRRRDPARVPRRPRPYRAARQGPHDQPRLDRPWPNPRGFLEVHRVPAPERSPQERVHDYGEIYQTLPEDELKHQASRCMDCGVPFCNNACPLGNLIPDWNDLARVGDWKGAIDQLHATNNFPEFTGLICPAPCESACVLDIDDDPVMIKQIEYWTIDNAFKEGWVAAAAAGDADRQEASRSSAPGPAGLAAAAELNKVGHEVTVYERDEAPGGLLRFGVPDAKLEKWMIDRRIDLLEQEGIEFVCDVDVGVDISVERLRRRARRRRSSRSARGSSATSRCPAASSTASTSRWSTSTAATAGSPSRRAAPPSTPSARSRAAGKRVVVIGGGDTGMDCVSNALREGAEDVLLLDVYPDVPADGRYPNTPWPIQPRRLRHDLRARGGRRAPLRPPGPRHGGRGRQGDAGSSPARSPATPRARSSASRAASSRSRPTSS